MADQVRSWLSSLSRHIPGFRGYELAAEREQSFRETKAWLVEHLQQVKKEVDQFTRGLVHEGRLDDLARWERVRHAIDHQVSRLGGMSAAYQGFFRDGDLDPDALEDLYDADANLLDEVDALLQKATRLAAGATAADGTAADGTADAWIEEVARITQRLDQREGFLKGRESDR